MKLQFVFVPFLLVSEWMELRLVVSLILYAYTYAYMHGMLDFFICTSFFHIFCRYIQFSLTL